MESVWECLESCLKSFECVDVVSVLRVKGVCCCEVEGEQGGRVRG